MVRFRWISLAVFAATVFATQACIGPPAPRFVIGGGEGNREIRIEVVNDNFADMTIMVMVEGSNFRLGDVTGKSSASFTVDPDRISPSMGLRLLADPIGSRQAYLSDEVIAGAGSIVVFNIAPALDQSFISLRG
jgi:hypothetical protein